MLVVSLVLGTAGVYAEQGIKTKLTLENVPAKAYAGDTISFSGRLVRADTGEGIARATIVLKIAKEGQQSPEEKIFLARSTDYEGRFSIVWAAESNGRETVVVRASYTGSASYSGSESEEYTIDVERIGLSVTASKTTYTNNEELVISGSGRPKDILAVFVKLGAHGIVITTKITVDNTGKFSTPLLTWDDSYEAGLYTVYVRSTSDILSSQKLFVLYEKPVVTGPAGIRTVLSLDPTPANATYGSSMSFSGRLATDTGLPIKDASILIKHRGGPEDGILTAGLTLKDGRFFASWRTLPVSPGDSVTVYASFEGGGGFLESASDAFQLTFRPRTLTLELNKARFLPNEAVVVSGTAPPGEWLSVELLDPDGQSIARKSLLVGDMESYEDELIILTKPSYVLPEGQYVVTAETATRDMPVLSASETLVFEKPRPLSQYKIIGSVGYEDEHGNRIMLEGARVTISSPYGEVQTYTDGSGIYAFHDLDSVAEKMRNVFSVKVDLDGRYFSITDGSKIVARIGGTYKIGEMHDIEVEPVVFSGRTDAAAARIFALQNDVVKFYTGVLGLEPEKIEIEIFSDETPKGKYGFEQNSEVPKIWIAKGVSSPKNPYTRDVLAHEYTHYMQDRYASLDHYRSMNHGGFSNPTTADSMVEGFADFMAGVISGHYGMEQAGRFFRYSLEENFKVSSKPFLSEELAIAGVFWDLYDSGGDDAISVGIGEIWDLMTSKYRFPAYSGHPPDSERYIYYLKDLHHVLTQQNPWILDGEEVEVIFNSHGIVDGLTDPARPDRI